MNEAVEELLVAAAAAVVMTAAMLRILVTQKEQAAACRQQQQQHVVYSSGYIVLCILTTFAVGWMLVAAPVELLPEACVSVFGFWAVLQGGSRRTKGPGRVSAHPWFSHVLIRCSVSVFEWGGGWLASCCAVLQRFAAPPLSLLLYTHTRRDLPVAAATPESSSVASAAPANGVCACAAVAAVL